MESLKKIQEYWKIITGIVSIILFIWGIFGYLQSLSDDNKKILDELKTTKQMALKSVIWSENIPITEQTTACDVYLSAGFNSMTKKRCEVLIDKGANNGIFSYTEER